MKKMYLKKITQQFILFAGKKKLLAMLFTLTCSQVFAQSAFTVTWPLTSDGTAIKTGAGAADVTGNNVIIGSTYQTQTYGAGGLSIAEGAANPWWTGRGTVNANDNFTGPGTEENMYVEFSVTAGLDKDLKINNINIPLSRPDGTGQLYYNIAYSTNGFTTITYVQGTQTSPTSTADAIESLNYTNDIIVPRGKSLAVRFMIWRRSTSGIAATQTTVLLKKDVVISGVVYEDANSFIVNWPLISNGTSTKYGTGVTGNNVFIGATYQTKTYSNSGLSLAPGTADPYWPADGAVSPNADFTGPEGKNTMYVEFSITAAADRDLKITDINVPLAQVGGNSTVTAAMAYSLDGFATVNNITVNKTTDATATYTGPATDLKTSYTNQIIVPRGTTLSIRFIFYRRQASSTISGAVYIVLSNAIIRGTSEETLPVKLSSFSGKLQGNHVALNWTTASEKNNSHFDILRSVDGKTFDKISSVQGNGTSDITHKYSYTDKSPAKGNNYYKLNQVDFDGKAEASEVIAVKAFDVQGLQVYQQGSTVSVLVNNAVAGVGTLTVADISGKVTSSRKIDLTTGNNQFDVDLGTAPKGVYLVKVLSAGKTLSAKFIK